jgi:Secretion system C-terminal sorting domain
MKHFFMVLLTIITIGAKAQIPLDIIDVVYDSMDHTLFIHMWTTSSAIDGFNYSIESLNDPNNTKVVKLYYDVCLHIGQNGFFFDTTFNFTASSPFDLMVYTIHDTCALCPNFPVSPILKDSLLLTYFQISKNDDVGADNQSIAVYPNPSNEFIEIQSEEEIASLALLTFDGRKVFDRLVNNKSYTLDIDGLASGNYFLMMSTKSGGRKVRLIVKI